MLQVRVESGTATAAWEACVLQLVRESVLSEDTREGRRFLCNLSLPRAKGQLRAIVGAPGHVISH